MSRPSVSNLSGVKRGYVQYYYFLLQGYSCWNKATKIIHVAILMNVLFALCEISYLAVVWILIGSY